MTHDITQPYDTVSEAMWRCLYILQPTWLPVFPERFTFPFLSVSVLSVVKIAMQFLFQWAVDLIIFPFVDFGCSHATLMWHVCLCLALVPLLTQGSALTIMWYANGQKFVLLKNRISGKWKFDDYWFDSRHRVTICSDHMSSVTSTQLLKKALNLKMNKH